MSTRFKEIGAYSLPNEFELHAFSFTPRFSEVMGVSRVGPSRFNGLGKPSKRFPA